MGTATVNGITVRYDDEGDGAPLVLVHGHPFDASMWAPQVTAFAGSGWRVIAADLRGYGGSTVVAGTTPLSAFAHDVFALLDHLGVGDVVLGGLSMGGQIAMECYRLFGPRIRGLLLADTFPQAETDQGVLDRNRMADRLLAEGMAGYTEEALPRMIARYNADRLPTVAAHVRAMMAGASAAGAAAALRGRALRPDYCQLLTEVSVPALVVVGRDDEFTPVRDAQDMYGLLPDATLAVIDGAGHLPNLEQPEAFNAVLDAFLARIGAPAG